MQPRFYCEQALEAGSETTLSGAEAHHLMRVRRLRVGETLCLFNGSGFEYQAEVLRCDRHGVQLRIRQGEPVDRESPVSLTLAVAMPKGDRQHFLIEKCVELGVARLVPLRTRYTVAEPAESACRRWRRAVIEASKQCGRNVLMQIDEPAVARDYFLDGGEPGTARWLLDEGFASASGGALPQPVPARVVAAVGPEAGWSDEEREGARAGAWTALGLGRRILRVETAALAIAAWCGLPHNGQR